jgi:hypothetical protein
MNDAKFKALLHRTGNDRVVTQGEVVSAGYKPDITIRDIEERLTFILECEQKTDRKAFLGALLKAELYAEQQCARPTLVIVMQPQSNTTTRQISNHLRPYIMWLADKQGGRMNLACVHVISDAEYETAIVEGEQLASVAFQRRGHLLRTATLPLRPADT